MERLLQTTAAIFRKHRWLYVLLPSLVVVAFCAKYMVTGSQFRGGDFDYYAQVYESFRASVLHFHQFPFWNPWAAGGVPLYANPQFGLISIQTVLVLLFGTIAGLKLSFVVYGLIGFWGMFMVARKLFAASYLRALGLGFIWIACGFFSYHDIDHITFLLFHGLPWLFLWFSLRHSMRFAWLWFGLGYSLIILTSPHYALLMSGLFFGIYYLFSKAITYGAAKTFDWRKDLAFAWKAASVIIVLTGYRLLLTWQYVQSAPRDASVFQETPNTVHLLLTALFVPVESLNAVPDTYWRWHEYSMFMGVGITIIVIWALVVLAMRIFARKRAFFKLPATPTKQMVLALILTAGVCFALALGDHGTFSPFHILRNLPGFEQTRVASRWLIIAVFCLLCCIAYWRPASSKQQRVITLLVIASAIELFATYFSLTATFKSSAPRPADYNRPFSQYMINPHPGRDTNFQDFRDSYYYSTTQNTGVINFDDSLISTLNGITARCANNKDLQCAFIRTGNAKLVSWTPNKIIIKRTGDGQIVLNMNPGNHWLVNGQRVFNHLSAAEPQQEFKITTPDKTITLEVIPKLSPQYLLYKLTH